MFQCKNRLCKYHIMNEKGISTCEKRSKIVIGSGGICENYEKGFIYYLTYYARKEFSNFICLPDVNAELRYSIYYMMKCLPIEFTVDDMRGILLLRNSETNKLISSEDFWDMFENVDLEKLAACKKEFDEQGLPKKKETEEKKVNYKEYGWVSPMGDFIESQFGTHEESAISIIKKNGWKNEWNEWKDVDNNLYLARDFVSIVKGYVLIDDPSGLGRYIVTNMKPLTKKQGEFLYGYFVDMGMTTRAEKYLQEVD